jgi:hypothetical protein
MKKIKENNGIDKNPPESKLKNFSKGYITFPISDEQFKKFIVGLLGKPQTISKRIKGNFEIHLRDIQNFHDLINQRIEQQNEGRLIQFRTKIYYSDNSSVEVGSYDELITYNQVKPVISLAVNLYWSYLIQFADKPVPEKQEIVLSIKSTSNELTILMSDDPILISDEGEFVITIQHTARTWGDDIESLLTNQINSIILKENIFKYFIRKKSDIIGIAIGLILIMGSLITGFVFTNNFYQSEIQRVANFNLQNPDINKRINFLTEYVASGYVTKFDLKVLIFFLFSIILSVSLGLWVKSLADTKTPSFLILTRESVKNAENIKEKLKRKWRWFVFSVFISVIAGVAANYIFKFLIS